MLLQRTGEPAKALTLFETAASAGNSRGVVLTETDNSWLKVAKSNI